METKEKNGLIKNILFIIGIIALIGEVAMYALERYREEFGKNDEIEAIIFEEEKTEQNGKSERNPDE